MPKNIHTPRDEMVCGKLDMLEDRLRELGEVELLYLVSDIRNDCERMEAKLVSRKHEVESLNKKTASGTEAGDEVMDCLNPTTARITSL
jgi:hypothetical protein